MCVCVCGRGVGGIDDSILLNTSPKTNETSDSAHRDACTDYPHIYRV